MPPATWDADEAVTALYAAHYRSLVRLGALLLHDPVAAEDVVQDAFVAMHRAWRRLRDPERALPYLRRAVINGSRSALRHRTVVDRHATGPGQASGAGVSDSAEEAALRASGHAEVLAALGRLPRRQREALVLRYYAELSEAEIAEAMGISRGAVKSHAARGIQALRTTLEWT